MDAPATDEVAVPVFAILGWRPGDDIRVLGSGTLIAPQLILTAGHVVTNEVPQQPGRRRRGGSSTQRGRVGTEKYRVSSPWAGIKTVRRFHFISAKAAQPGEDLAIIELVSEVPDGLEPVEFGQSGPDPGRARCFGFGGDQTGLLQEVPSWIVPCEEDDGVICLDPRSGLGPRDSGAPLIVRAPDGNDRLSGIYVGLRWSQGSAKSPRAERFAIGAGPHLKSFEKVIEDHGGTRRSGSRKELSIGPPPDSTVDGTQYGLGAGKTREHDFLVDARNGVALIVTVNATVLSLRSWPRMTVRLYRNDKLVDSRAFPGPFQTFRRRGKNAGRWRIKVESETEIVYQVLASLYVSD